MAVRSILIISLQACFIQMAFTQYANYGPQFGIAGPQISLSGGIGPLGPNPNNIPGNLAPGYFNSPASYSPGCGSGYGGSGSGDVAVVGELPVAGSTFVAGQVPVIGGVQFGGQVPAAGTITITGSCSCGSNYGY